MRWAAPRRRLRSPSPVADTAAPEAPRPDRTRSQSTTHPKGPTTRLTAPAYWKFESISLQRRVHEPSVPASHDPIGSVHRAWGERRMWFQEFGPRPPRPARQPAACRPQGIVLEDYIAAVERRRGPAGSADGTDRGVSRTPAAGVTVVLIRPQKQLPQRHR